MRPTGTAAELEARRFRAAELLREGKSTAEVARLLGAGHSSVKKWKAALARGGPEALAAKPAPPRSSKLSDSQKEQLVEILLRGPLASGYRTDLWTCRRVADVVQRTFGVSYHPDHLGRILHELGFTPQKPEQLARERDEEAIRRWREVDWPRIKRGRAVVEPSWLFLMKPAFVCSR
jgi:transposase